MKTLILGAGPAGLGAAWRFEQLGHVDWELWEQDPVPGGLSASVVDEHGFTWDLGGHVQFSHYQSFDNLMDELLGPEGWLWHERESWIRCRGAWVPYPFQYNIHRLPKEDTLRCFQGLLAARRNGVAAPGASANFDDWIFGSCGEGLAELFMRPYNFKVWAWPPQELATGWIGERVALPDLARIAESVILGKDNLSWGPNNRFRFPKHGGTGAVWRELAGRLPADRLHFGRRVARIDPARRTVTADDGTVAVYDRLITTLPLDRLVDLAGLDELRPAAGQLRYSSTHIIGVALEGQPGPDLQNKCWMYFPEADCPFYRVTVFSHYSPFNVPDIKRQWSLIAEVSESPVKPVDTGRVVDETIYGMLATGLIERPEAVHHTWRARIERGYPTPGLGRDAALECLLPALEKFDIYSRGRFGAWKYEVANQDHAFMQGVEVVNRLLHGSPELTLWFPNLVNQPHPVYGKDWL